MAGLTHLHRTLNRVAKLLAILSSLSLAAAAFAQEIVTLSARPEIVQSYFLASLPTHCSVTPYADAARLVDKYPVISVFGGRAAESEPCDPFSAHGFYGMESETIAQIVNWILKKPFLEEVK